MHNISMAIQTVKHRVDMEKKTSKSMNLLKIWIEITHYKLEFSSGMQSISFPSGFLSFVAQKYANKPFNGFQSVTMITTFLLNYLDFAQMIDKNLLLFTTEDIQPKYDENSMKVNRLLHR